jgi:hypothetical protein
MVRRVAFARRGGRVTRIRPESREGMFSAPPKRRVLTSSFLG